MEEKVEKVLSDCTEVSDDNDDDSDEKDKDKKKSNK